TLCNMSIEAGARAGLISPDETTFAYLKGKKHSPEGEAFEEAVRSWKALASDEGAVYDRTIELDGAEIEPQVTWGTNQSMSGPIHGTVPDPSDYSKSEQPSIENALDYMGLEPGTRMTDIEVEHVFLGSCTNSRISDLRSAARVVAGKQVAP